jgi:hypothetical protein
VLVRLSAVLVRCSLTGSRLKHAVDSREVARWVVAHTASGRLIPRVAGVGFFGPLWALRARSAATRRLLLAPLGTVI